MLSTAAQGLNSLAEQGLLVLACPLYKGIWLQDKTDFPSQAVVPLLLLTHP